MAPTTSLSVHETRPDCPARYHDTYSATRKAGCTCPLAKERRRVYIKRQQHGYLQPAYTDATGTRRRLQALSAIGWPLRDLVRRIGWTGNPGPIMWGASNRVHRHTADAVAQIYSELSDTPGPSNKARAAAKRAGYVPPAAWDNIDDPAEQPNLGGPGDDILDEEAIRRVLAGTAPYGSLNRAERVEAFRRLRAAGCGNGTIRSRLRINPGTLARLIAAAEQDEVAA